MGGGRGLCFVAADVGLDGRDARVLADIESMLRGRMGLGFLARRRLGCGFCPYKRDPVRVLGWGIPLIDRVGVRIVGIEGLKWGVGDGLAGEGDRD